MIGINKGPIVAGLETVFMRITAEQAAKAIGRGKMVAAIFQNPLLNAGGEANAVNILIGSASNQIYLMLPGQESPIVYAEDQKDIYVRAAASIGAIAAATLNPDGAGYTIGDVLTLQGGSFTAQVTVLTVSGGGDILTFSITNPGNSYLVGTTYFATGGTGAGAGFLITELVEPEVIVTVFLYRLREDGLQ